MSSVKDFYTKRYANLPPGARESDDESTFARRVTAALHLISDHPRRILDFGCGRGSASAIFDRAGHRVTGVDISPSAIETAGKRVPNAKFYAVDNESLLPFPDQSFEFCFASEVIEHLFDVRGFTREIARVLAPGGLFVLTTPYHGWLKNLLVISTGFEKHFNVNGGHIRFFTRNSISECLIGNDFVIKEIVGVGRFWPIWKTMFVVAVKE